MNFGRYLLPLIMLIDSFTQERYKAHRNFYADYLNSSLRPSVEEREYKPDMFNGKDKVNLCPHSTIIRKYMLNLGRTVSLVVPCGKCMWCLHRKQNAIIYRIWQHSRSYKNTLFVTLTYNDEHYPCDVKQCRIDSQKFYKRLRRCFPDVTLSYFHVCERGKRSGRLHHHFLLFWNGDLSVSKMRDSVRSSWFSVPNLEMDFETYNSSYGRFLTADIDKYKRSRLLRTSIGFTYFGSVSPYSITYVTKYCLKDGINLHMFHSWSNGLGYTILEVASDMQDKLRYLSLQSYVPDPVSGKVRVVPTPKYYKDKLLNQFERAFLFDKYLNSQSYLDKLHAVRDEKTMKRYLDLFTCYMDKSLWRESVHERQRVSRGSDI